jgi:hypothetical protein
MIGVKWIDVGQRTAALTPGSSGLSSRVGSGGLGCSATLPVAVLPPRLHGCPDQPAADR